MKVALISEWLDAWRGGAETSTLQFLHHLMDSGIEVHVFTRSRPASTPEMVVHTISGASMSRMRRSVTFANRVRRALAKEAFDVVHAISPCRGADLYQPRGGTVAETIERNIALRDTVPARRLKRYASRLNLKQRYMLRMERQLLGDPRGPIVVAISDYVVRQLKEHYQLADGRVRKVYNAVDANSLAPDRRAAHRRALRAEFGVAPDDLLVLSIAHNFRLKGIQRWMEAMALLIQRRSVGVRSLVIGRGDSARWHRLAAKLGLGKRLLFVGPSERIAEFLHAADVLVHPTYYDPCSRVVLEGMVAGLPCITTRWDGAAEMIETGRNGFVLTEPTDVADLADCVERLADGAVRRRVGENASAVVHRVSMERHAKEMFQLYNEVRSAKGGRR